MTDHDKKRLVQLREFTREQYESLEGGSTPIAQMKVSDTAWILSTIVRSLDDLLRDHVTFTENKK